MESEHKDMVKLMQENKKQTRTVQEEMVRERKYWKQNQIWALVVAAVLLLNLLGGSGFSVATGPEELTLTMHNGQVCTVPYSSITEVRLLEEPQYGTMTEGKETRQGKSGTWESPEWGSYTLCVYSSSSCAVWMQAEGRCYVVNLTSAVETQQLYQIVQEKSPVSK